MKWLASCISVAGVARRRSLAARMTTFTRATRRFASGSSVGSGTIIIDTRLPNVPACSGVRTDTGTIASSGSVGRSSAAASQRRSAPALSPSTTSLTVTPSAFLTALTSASGSEANAKRRCGPIRRLK
jgi:hypothetical protein